MNHSVSLKKSLPLWLKWCFCAIPAAIGALMYFLLPRFPQFTEHAVTRGLFRIVGFPLAWLISVIPFSVAEVLLVLSVPAVLTALILWIRRMVKVNGKLRFLERSGRFLAWCLSLVFLLYMVMHGGNFSRLSTGELLELPSRTYTKEDLYTLTSDLAAKASQARERLSEDENGCITLSVSRSDLLLMADDGYHALEGKYPFLKAATWRVKPVMLSHWWSYTGIVGIYIPWLGEANLNVDVPDNNLAFSAAHEVAHTMGFAKEDECNFLAWLSCSASDQPDYAYSGYLSAFVYCSNALYKADKELWKQAYSNCSAGVLRDLTQNNTYWDQFEGKVQEVSNNLNDSFIKVNGVESGVLSYDEMVALLLRYYDKQGAL